MAATKKVQDKPGAQARPRPASVKGAPGTVTSASSWKKQSVEGTLITVPSGNTALVRAPGMQVFLTEGVIPNGLMSLVQEAMVSGQAPKGLDESEFLKDPAKLQQIIDLADAVTVYCCIDPKVQPAPRDEGGNVLPVRGREPRHRHPVCRRGRLHGQDVHLQLRRRWGYGGPGEVSYAIVH